MTYNPEIHSRHSIRLRGYDYSQAGAYFVTICAFNRECLFGEVMDGEMRLGEAGQIAQTVWNGLPNHYQNVELDAFVVMPNHVHGIIVLTDFVGAGFKPAHVVESEKIRAGLKPAPTGKSPLSEMVRAFKTFSARRINQMRDNPGQPVWQRNYYEHVIRNDEDLDKIRQYIADNPMKWELDENNPANAGTMGL